MILEGLVTTIAADDRPHLAPMGPTVTPHFDRFTLRPFPTSTTYQNLVRHGEGVLHVTDDVLLLAQAAVGAAELPVVQPAASVRGFILANACRYFEFVVRSIDPSEQRVRIEADVVARGTLRDFFGFNRAKHAVLEAAILATRFTMLPAHQIDDEFRRLRVIVDKTAGPVEQEAMAFLESRWVSFRQGDSR
jgi:uncharacterized protein